MGWGGRFAGGYVLGVRVRVSFAREFLSGGGVVLSRALPLGLGLDAIGWDIVVLISSPSRL